MKQRTPLMLLGSVGLLIIVCESSAHAYLDAGSGSMIVQLLVGGFAGIGLYIKLTWRRWRARWTHSETSSSDKSNITK